MYITEHLEDSQRMFSKLHEKKNCDKITDESLPSSDRRKRRAPDKQKTSSTKINSMPAPTPTTQLTPTTSNASSGTPTPQPKRRKVHVQQRSLPTPPASVHSSNDTDRHRRLSTLVDIEQVKEEIRNYKFDRRKFSEKNAADVRFYNNLLKLQRMELQLRRKRGDNEPKAPPKSNSAKSNPQKLKRLRTANTKLHQTIDRLHSDIDTICKYAVEEIVHKKPQPVVRLKRLHIKSLETDKQGEAVDAAEVSVRLDMNFSHKLIRISIEGIGEPG